MNTTKIIIDMCYLCSGETQIDIPSELLDGKTKEQQLQIAYHYVKAHQEEIPTASNLTPIPDSESFDVDNIKICYAGDTVIKKTKRKATNIEWDVDDEDMDSVILPSSLDIPDDIDDEDIEDYLSDVTGFCHKGFCLEDNTPSTVYDLVLHQKSDNHGLTRTEIIDMLDMMQDEVLPIDLHVPHTETSAIGFISLPFARELKFEYERLTPYIQKAISFNKHEVADSDYTIFGHNFWFVNE